MPPPPGLDAADDEGSSPANGHPTSSNKPPPSAAREIGSADSDAAHKDSNGSDAQAKGLCVACVCRVCVALWMTLTAVAVVCADPTGGSKQVKPAWSKIPTAPTAPAVRINCNEWPTPNATPTPPPPPVKAKPSVNPLSRSEDKAATVSQSVLPPTASWYASSFHAFIEYSLFGMLTCRA